MRWITLLLVIVALMLQGQLWLSESGFSTTHELEELVRQQYKENELLRERNQAFEAEVIDLKNGQNAAEERARNDLGLIGKTETFYHVVPSLGDRMVADRDR